MSGDYGSYLPDNINPEDEEQSKRIDFYHKYK